MKKALLFKCTRWSERYNPWELTKMGVSEGCHQCFYGIR